MLMLNPERAACLPGRINVVAATGPGGTITFSLRRLPHVICHLYDTTIEQHLIFCCTLSVCRLVSLSSPLSLTYIPYINPRLIDPGAHPSPTGPMTGISRPEPGGAAAERTTGSLGRSFTHTHIDAHANTYVHIRAHTQLMAGSLWNFMKYQNIK